MTISHYAPDPSADVWEAENLFYLRGHPSRLGKLLAHYELYKRILDVPGAVMELGVYKGASLVRFATFRAMLESAYSRPILGFDAFGTFPRAEVLGGADQDFIERFEAAGGIGIARETLEQAIVAKGFENVRLQAGNVFDTVPRWLTDNPSQKIALLHLDMDVYEPTAFAIEQLYGRMARGGLIVFDDYTSVEGATRAADELCARLDLRMAKLPFYTVPSFVTVP